VRLFESPPLRCRGPRLTLLRFAGCTFLDVYGEWYFYSTLVAIPWNFISGWMTDFFHKRARQLMLTFSAMQLVMWILMCATVALCRAEVLPRDWMWFMSIFWQVRQVAISQSLMSVWKLLKIRMDIVAAEYIAKDPSYQRESGLENIDINSIGNNGDLGISFPCVPPHFTEQYVEG